MSNLIGETMKRFELAVIIEPHIDDTRSSSPLLTVVKGQRVRIDCAVEAAPRATVSGEASAATSIGCFEVSWTRNEKRLEAAAGYTLENQNQTLVIESASASDAGRFVCHGQNAFGDAKRNFLLSLVTMPTFDALEATVLLGVGDNRLLNCTPSGGQKPFTFTWRLRNGTQLLDPLLLVNDAHLVISSALLNHTGVYECEVRAGGSSPSSPHSRNRRRTRRAPSPKRLPSSCSSGRVSSTPRAPPARSSSSAARSPSTAPSRARHSRSFSGVGWVDAARQNCLLKEAAEISITARIQTRPVAFVCTRPPR